MDDRRNLPVGTIYLEDIEVGMTRSASKTIGDREVTLFAEVSGDHNPVHFDEDYARGTIFEGRITHSMLTAALISGVIGALNCVARLYRSSMNWRILKKTWRNSTDGA